MATQVVRYDRLSVVFVNAFKEQQKEMRERKSVSCDEPRAREGRSGKRRVSRRRRKGCSTR